MSNKHDLPGSEPPDGAGHGDLRSYGRRRGRRLRERQSGLVAELLPRVGLPLDGPPPEDLTSLFPETVSDVWLEIGFGGGEHIVWQAAQQPQIGFIGCEPFIDGVAKVLSAIDDQSLENIRLHANDARDVIRWLPPGSIGRAFILFPDPWPKMKHRKRRLVTAALLRELARVLRPGAELRMASDIGDYAAQMLFAARVSGCFSWLAENPRDWRERPEDWPRTRYEEKALREGRRPAFLRFVRTETQVAPAR